VTKLAQLSGISNTAQRIGVYTATMIMSIFYKKLIERWEIENHGSKMKKLEKS
jgi:hypothetical protein